MGSKLKNLKGLWKTANENKGAGGFDELDDGRYLTKVIDTDVNESQGSGRLQMMIEFQVQEGEFVNKTKRLYTGLDSEQSVQIAVNTLSRLGLEIDDPETLDEDIKQILGSIVKIQLKTKAGKGDSGTFQNVYILKVLGTGSIGGGSSEAKPVEDLEPVDEIAKPKAKKGKAAPAKATPAKAEVVPEELVADAPKVIDDGAGVELKVGMPVFFNLDKKEVEGEVVTLEEEKDTAIVSHNGKKYRVAVDQISVAG